MPSKDPDVWAAIWTWAQLNVNWVAVQSAAWAVFMSLLRAAFMRKRRAFRYTLIDAVICASIASAVVPICSHLFGHTEYTGFAGTMIGFIGTEKLREFLFRFLNQRIERGESHGYREEQNEYDDKP